MIACDQLILARWCLPIAPSSAPIEQGGVAINKGRIAAIGPAHQLTKQFQPQTKIALDNHVLLPGLVNAHCHAAMTLLRGAAEDLELQSWLRDAIWPLEARMVTPEFVRIGTDLAMAEMLSRGITCFADHYFFPEEAAARVAQVGMRAQIAFPITDCPNPWCDSPQEAFRRGVELHDAYRDDDYVGIAFGPHSAYSVATKNLEKTLMYAEEIHRPIQIHLHENAAEVEDAFKRTGQSWVAHLHHIGLLNSNLQAVHMTQLTEDEIKLVAECGTQIVHCPYSNLKLASGLSPISKLAKADVKLALGTDGAASNNALDLFAEARLAALLIKHGDGNASAGTVTDMMRMATLGGAEVLGLDKQIGSLESGKWADLIAVDLSDPAFVPVRDPASALIHGPAGSAVSHVWVAGRSLYAEGDHQTLSLEEVCTRANLHLERMQ